MTFGYCGRANPIEIDATIVEEVGDFNGFLGITNDDGDDLRLGTGKIKTEVLKALANGFGIVPEVLADFGGASDRHGRTGAF